MNNNIISLAALMQNHPHSNKNLIIIGAACLFLFMLLMSRTVLADGDTLNDSAEQCTGDYTNPGDTGTCTTDTCIATCSDCSGYGTLSAGVYARPGSDACISDSDYDGDGYDDNAERNFNTSNAGNVGAPYGDGAAYNAIDDTGTHPIYPDTDEDGLVDGFEKCTGVYVSSDNSITN